MYHIINSQVPYFQKLLVLIYALAMVCKQSFLIKINNLENVSLTEGWVIST